MLQGEAGAAMPARQRRQVGRRRLRPCGGVHLDAGGGQRAHQVGTDQAAATQHQHGTAAGVGAGLDREGGLRRRFDHARQA